MYRLSNIKGRNILKFNEIKIDTFRDLEILDGTGEKNECSNHPEHL